jgi:hypothetical protein
MGDFGSHLAALIESDYLIFRIIMVRSAGGLA